MARETTCREQKRSHAKPQRGKREFVLGDLASWREFITGVRQPRRATTERRLREKRDVANSSDPTASRREAKENSCLGDWRLGVSASLAFSGEDMRRLSVVA